MKCKNCVHLYRDWCPHKLDSPDPDLDRECKDYKQATNADRIRAMTDEELAILLCRIMDCSICKRNIQKDGECDNYSADGLSKAVLNWLQRPAEEDNNGH